GQVAPRRGGGRPCARVSLDRLLERRDDPHCRHPVLVRHRNGEGFRADAGDRCRRVVLHRRDRHADVAPRRDRDPIAQAAAPVRRRGAASRYPRGTDERRGDVLMLHVVERKWWYFLASGLLIVPGVIFLLIGGLKPGIEFRGGTLLDVTFSGSTPEVTQV